MSEIPVRSDSVLAVVFRRAGGAKTFRYLVLKRAPSHGGFWQTVSGNLDEGELPEVTAAREVAEETGLQPKRVLPIEFVNTFYNNGAVYLEPCFGVEVESEAVTLSDEHVESAWVTERQALALLRWPGNRMALMVLSLNLKRGEPAERRIGQSDTRIGRLS